MSGKTEFFEDVDVSEMFFEYGIFEERKFSFDFNGLYCGGFVDLLVFNFKSNFIGVVFQIGFVFVANIQKNVVSKCCQVIDVSFDAESFCMGDTFLLLFKK
ncbi:hypothetical protein D3C87_1735010 [compost metagenome]